MSGSAPILGTWAGIVTPFDDRRRLDLAGFKHLVDYLAGRDVEGVALLTEAGEDQLLQPEERKQLVKAVSAGLAGKKPFVVFISAVGSLEAVDLARIAEAKGAAAVVLSLPRAPGIGYRELYRHLDRMARSVTVPILLLDRPGGVLESLQPEELVTLVGHESLVGVVAPHATGAEIGRWKSRFGDRASSILSGCSLSALEATRAGAVGTVCAMACVASEQAHRLHGLIADGDNKAAEQLESSLSAAVELMGPPSATAPLDGLKKLATRIANRPLQQPALPTSYPAPLLKAALKLQGHPVRAEVRPPLETARPPTVEKLKAVLQRSGILT